MACVAAFSSCKKKANDPGAQSGFQQGQSGPYTSSSSASPNGPEIAGSPDAGCEANQPCQPAPGQVPPLGTVGSDPNALTSLIAGALAGAAAQVGGFTPGGELAPVEQGIKMQAKTEAKGMRPEGQLMHAKLGTDGHAEGSMTLEPNRCYTIVGFGGLGVLAYQINIITAPPLPPQVLAQSGADGRIPDRRSQRPMREEPLPHAHGGEGRHARAQRPGAGRRASLSQVTTVSPEPPMRWLRDPSHVA